MAIVLKIYATESSNSESFLLYDQTVWSPAFVPASATAATLTVVYNGVTYTYTTGTGLLADLGIMAGYTNFIGASPSSYFEIHPHVLMFGVTPLNATYFPDGYYEITLTVTYGGSSYADTTYQGFLSEAYLMASQLPLQLDLNDFNYEENRLSFMCVALLQSAKWAAELGRSSQFTKFSDKVNSFLDARDISRIWSA